MAILKKNKPQRKHKSSSYKLKIRQKKIEKNSMFKKVKFRRFLRNQNKKKGDEQKERKENERTN